MAESFRREITGESVAYFDKSSHLLCSCNSIRKTDELRLRELEMR